jgi:flagellar motility protein MotE (MotC chaperone)
VVDKNPKNEITATQQPNVTPQTTKIPQGKEYTDWITKVTSIYSGMEPKKAAKIIQTYSDNVARDILYNMNKKTAAKVVSELSPETANRIFRFE